MISVIIGLVFCLLGIIIIVISIVEDEDGLAAGLVIILAALFVVGFSHGMGYKSFSPNLEEKAYIENALKTNPSMFIIEKAEDYNKNIDSGNNLWCRFSKEDRSVYYIDINSFIAKEN